jgi:glycosyltransferase involved in cell wall biosynthesis
MNQPLISIVLPTYNGSKYLATSIQSCINQTWQQWELILINDCSSDNTLEIANAFAAKEPRIKVYSNEKNLKLPMSLNKGFSLAHGELFTWTSDDNYYAPNALEVMAQSLLAAPDAMLVYADETLIDDDGNITGEWVMGNVQEGVAKWKGCGGCFLYRAAMQDALKGYDPAMFMIEDYDFFLRGFVRFSYNYLRRADLYFYRFHPASLTGKYMPYVAELQKLSIEKQLDALSQKTSKHDYALLLRKMSVHYIINKGNATKYAVYMHQLRKTSIKQWMLTIVYVPFKGGARWLQQMFQSLKLFFTQLLTS